MIDFNKMRICIKRIATGNFFVKLIKNNTGYSAKNFLLVVVTIVCTILLAVPVYCLIVEAYYNHTINTDLTSMAAYITAVAAVFTSVGLTKVWSEKYEHRLPGPDGIIGTDDDIVVNVTDEEWKEIVKHINTNKKCDPVYDKDLSDNE